MRQLYARLVLFLIRPALDRRLTANKRDEGFVNDAMREAATKMNPSMLNTNNVNVGAVDVTSAEAKFSNVSIDPIYCTDDYPRDGCTIVIDLRDGRYGWCVYHPRLQVTAPGTPMESYFSRPIGSLGVALDSFMRHRPKIETLIAMSKAEKSYAESSVSSEIL